MGKFAEMLKNARKRAGIEQAQLAEKVNISTVTLSRYENGHKKPNIEDLNKLAAALVSVSNLIGKTPEITQIKGIW